MKLLFVSLAVVSLCVSQLSAGTGDPRETAHPRSVVFIDQTPVEDPADPADTTATIRPRLLPENLSFAERALWGESGFFRSIGIASPLTPEVRRHELGVRRTMLTAHQIGGFLTLGLMYATVYYGQRVLDGHVAQRDTHNNFVAATIVSYSATALLAVLSPPPLIRRDEGGTTSIHKTLAWIHAAGMILTPIIGSMVWKFQGRGPSRTLIQNDSAARFHQISAYTTTAVFTASMVVMTF